VTPTQLFEVANITVNISALTPGVRLRAPALTSRGLKEDDKVRKLLKDFVPALESNEELKALKEDVRAFAVKFPMPGFADH